MKKQAVIRAGLEALYFTRAHSALGTFMGGVGAILTLHHVRPIREGDFQPNRLLEISPEFLSDTVERLLDAGLDLVSLDEMHRRMRERDFSRRFMCFTLDDGYRDNREWAYPIFRRFNVPFAIYLPTSFLEGKGELWWLVLERVVAGNDKVEAILEGRTRVLPCATAAQKRTTYEELYWDLRARPTEEELRAFIRDLAARHGVDVRAPGVELCMSWDEVKELASDELVTFGAHTVTHPMLSKLPEADVLTELEQSATIIERKLGKRPAHFSYPVGDPGSAGPREFAIAAEAGFKTAVTTRPGVLFPDHSGHMLALPRISLNGEFQRQRYVDVLLSGAATALWNRFRRVNAA